MPNLDVQTFLWIVAIASPIAMFAACCALTSMDHKVTRKPIIVAFLLIAWSWGCGWFGSLDYLIHGETVLWPRLILGGMAGLAVGNALLWFSNMRRCSKEDCPGASSIPEFLRTQKR